MKKFDNNLQCSVYAIFNEPKHERHVGFGLLWDLLNTGRIKKNISPIVLCLVLLTVQNIILAESCPAVL